MDWRVCQNESYLFLSRCSLGSFALSCAAPCIEPLTSDNLLTLNQKPIESCWNKRKQKKSYKKPVPFLWNKNHTFIHLKWSHSQKSSRIIKSSMELSSRLSMPAFNFNTNIWYALTQSWLIHEYMRVEKVFWLENWQTCKITASYFEKELLRIYIK